MLRRPVPICAGSRPGQKSRVPVQDVVALFSSPVEYLGEDTGSLGTDFSRLSSKPSLLSVCCVPGPVLAPRRIRILSGDLNEHR